METGSFQRMVGCLLLTCVLVCSANGELVVAEGLAVEPFATEDQLSNPASIDVDDRGRVWVGEAVNYRKKARKDGDRILILEDSDGDGRADKTKVFYQDPDIDGVHGICVLGNQAIVSAPDRILLLTDTDGDDKADEKKLLFKGKVLNPVHGQHDHAIHAVMFGPDGRLYFNFGNYSAGLWRADGSLVKDVFGNPVDNSRKPYQEGMVIRCEMDGSRVEVLGHNFRNNWEVTVDSFGSMWQSDNDNGSSSCRVNFVMEYGNYGYRDEMTGADYHANRTNVESTVQRRMWHQNDPGVVPNLLITGRGAPTGILVYEGTLLPEPFRGQMIHAEPGRNMVWAFPAKQVGAGYQASITNLVHSKGDRNYRPSDVSVAPDGSLIIADWFDPVDCCHRTLNDAGRIFRVAPPKHAYVLPEFDFKTPAGAAKALRNPNLAVRYKAWTALLAMQEKARPDLTKMAADKNPRFRARALWALAAIEAGASQAIEKALQDEDDNLRALALRITRRHGMLVEPIVRRLVRDESALVRRECSVSLHRVATPKAAELWAELALQHDGRDRWYLEALGIGEQGNETACFKAWLKKVGDAWNDPVGRDIVWRSRAPEAADLLAKLVLDPKVPESDHPRLMRAFDFHSGKLKEDALASLLLALDGPAESRKSPATEPGFTSIFNGRDLTGWEGDKKAWAVVDGAIQCTGGNTKKNWLIWRGGELRDFELRLSFKFTKGNSGVQVRSKEIAKWQVRGYQVEIADATKMGLWHHSLAPEKYRSHLATAGQLARIDTDGKKTVEQQADPIKVQSVCKDNEWNELVVTAVGPRLVQKINGVVFAELVDEDAKHSTRSGLLALQDHGKGCVAAFKDIRIKHLRVNAPGQKPPVDKKKSR
jgi:putative membrane-bound dehydrogenase-like protein